MHAPVLSTRRDDWLFVAEATYSHALRFRSRDRAVARVARPPGVEAAGHGSSALELVIFPPETVVPCCLVSAWMDSKRLPLTRGATKGLQRARCLRSLGGFR